MTIDMKVDEKLLAQDEQIMAYLRGKLAKEQETQFMQQLEHDQAMKERAVSMARLATATAEAGREQDARLRDAFRSVDESTARAIANRATGHRNLFALTAKVLCAAACIACVVFAGVRYNQYLQIITLGKEFALPFTPAQNTRGEIDENVEQELGVLIGNVYSNKDLTKTLARLAVLWQAATQESYNGYTSYATEIGWALATGYLMDNRRTEAVAVLTRMEQLHDRDTYMGERIRQLQKRIDDI